MERKCEYIDNCPMFKYFERVAKQLYLEIYCEGNFEICVRRELRQAGKPVPDRLLPHGGMLWQDGEN